MYHLSIGNVEGLEAEDAIKLQELQDVYNFHRMKNEEKAKYYEGHIKLREVNLGIALPRNFGGLEIGCEWGGKCVDVLASRSMFDGFVSANGQDVETMRQIMEENKLEEEYSKAVRDQLKFGCTFATLSADGKGGCRIRFHSPMTAAGLWNGEKGRIDCGIAIIDSVPDEVMKDRWIPSRVNMYTDEHIIVLVREGNSWNAEYLRHRMGRPLMEPMIWNPTSDKPFGRSRIKEPIRRLIEAYIRTMANATIGLEFSTTPQKYIMGITDQEYDALIDDKFKQYVGSILAATANPETGEKPSFGQLPQGTIQPHVDMLRMLATQFSAASGLTVTDTGVVNDANPTSSEAIIAQSQTLILMAEELDRSNGNALKVIAQMAQAIVKETTIEGLEQEERDIYAHFKNPAMPSQASTADAAVKIASARDGFSQTDVFLEMMGFSQADIRRIKAQEARARGEKILMEEFGNADINEGLDGVHPEDEGNQ